MSNKTETWKKIIGFEGYYEVSNLGRIRSLDRTINNKRWGKSQLKGKILSTKRRVGHPQYVGAILYNKLGQKKQIAVHRVVAEAFIPNPLGKPQVNHIDHNPLNNNVNNLEWVTPSENIKKSFEFGQRKIIKGAKHHNTKLSNLDYQAIKLLHNMGYGYDKLSNMFGVTRSTIKKYTV
jgi:hypothetical protein